LLGNSKSPFFHFGEKSSVSPNSCHRRGQSSCR